MIKLAQYESREFRAFCLQDFWYLKCISAVEVFKMPSTQTYELTDLAQRARAEFREMPGMSLTTAQAARLWQLSPDTAEVLLADLVQAGFLVRRDGQRYKLPSSV